MGWAALVVAVVGLLFIIASLLSLIRIRGLRWRDTREVLFLLGLVVIFVLQLITALHVVGDPNDQGQVRTIAILVIVCFLVGIARAWELIGGPSIRLTQEIGVRLRHNDRRQGNTDDT